MNGNDTHRLTDRELRAQSALRALSIPHADLAFRERLKREFVAGTVQSRIAWPVLRSRRFAPSRRLAATLAIAATLAFVLLAANRSPGPRAIGGNGLGFVSIDGARLPAGELGRIGALIRPGATLVLGDGATLDLEYPGNMGWRLFSGTTATLPSAPGRWFRRSVESWVEFGEISVRTGGDFHGSQLTLATAEGRAIVTGTLVSVVRDSSVTCVCVHEGTVRMEAAGRDLGSIRVGKRRVLFRDGSEPVILDIAAPHRDHLIEFDADLDH
jgi:hypothetical protein